MSDPRGILTRLYGMLEFDGIESPQEFTLMISALHVRGNITIERISKHLDTSGERIREWSDGIHIPEVVFMPLLVKKVMSLIKEELRS